MTAYKEAIRLDPGFAAAHGNLGNILLMRGRHEEAVAEFGAVLANQPTSQYIRERLDYCLRVQRGEVPTAPPPRALTR